MVDFSSSTTISAGRDQRLSLMGQIFDVTEMGLRVHFTAKSEIDRFYRDVAGVLMKLDNLQRLISPLPGIFFSSWKFGRDLLLISLSLDSGRRTRKFLLFHIANTPSCLSAFVPAPLSS